MNSTNVDWIGYVMAGIAAFYFSQVALRKREVLGARVRRLMLGSIGGMVAWLFVSGSVEVRIGSAFAAALLASHIVRMPKRSRHIPRSVRRAVVARDLKGKKFNGKIHHLDHIVPFSEGGDNSTENLRVVSKEENLKRGAKMPGLRDLI